MKVHVLRLPPRARYRLGRHGETWTALYVERCQHGLGELLAEATSLANTLGGLGGSSSSLDLKAVYAIPGGATTMPTCNTLTTVMTSLVASGTPTANYTGCNPISGSATPAELRQASRCLASPVLTLTTGTTTDLQGHNLTIVAGREFLNCVNATLNGVDSILCDVNMTRINGASGSTLYMGATLCWSRFRSPISIRRDL